MRDVTNQWATYFYVQDSWRIRPSLTLYYGLSYGFRLAPPSRTRPANHHDSTPRPAQEVDGSRHTWPQRSRRRWQGRYITRPWGWNRCNDANKSVFNADYGDVAPARFARLEPSGKGWRTRKTLLGERKTVIRGGFAMVYDRSLTVQSVEIPMLGIGFDANHRRWARRSATSLARAERDAPRRPAAPIRGFPVSEWEPTGASSARSDGRSPYIADRSRARGGANSTFQGGPEDEGRPQLQFRFQYSARVARQYDSGSCLSSAALARDLPQAVNAEPVAVYVRGFGVRPILRPGLRCGCQCASRRADRPDRAMVREPVPGLGEGRGVTATSATAYIVGANKSNIRVRQRGPTLPQPGHLPA